MIGFNGGLIGKTRTTTATPSVPGVWTPREQLEALRNSTWPVDSDPNYSSVSLLLHGDGADGSTTFTDNSPTPKVPTNFGNVISTAQSKFGGASIFANSSYMEYAANTDFELGSGAFTIECWYRGTSAANFASIISKGTISTTAGSYGLHFRSANNTIAFYLGAANDNVITSTTSIRTAATWFHIAVTRSGNSTRLFINGTQEGITYGFDYNITTGGVLTVGRDSYSTSFKVNGYIDDVRITKGVARYTTNFPAPTAPFPNF